MIKQSIIDSLGGVVLCSPLAPPWVLSIDSLSNRRCVPGQPINSDLNKISRRMVRHSCTVPLGSDILQ